MFLETSVVSGGYKELLMFSALLAGVACRSVPQFAVKLIDRNTAKGQKEDFFLLAIHSHRSHSYSA